MSANGDVTHWLRQLQAGNREPVQKLWERYYRELVILARKKLGDLPRRVADEEDVALSAFDSFIRRAEQGRFPRLEDRDNLWRLLVVITLRKSIDLITHEGRERRDWRRLQQNSPEDCSLLSSLLGREPDPAFAAEVAEQCQRLLALLPDDQLRQIALRKLEGFSNAEIAEQIQRPIVAVERRLALIRQYWDSAEATGTGEESFPK
jgi:DNA-directed RNA polymerase specialized sigma24 family protein